jgi:hypothetical protein
MVVVTHIRVLWIIDNGLLMRQVINAQEPPNNHFTHPTVGNLLTLKTIDA